MGMEPGYITYKPEYYIPYKPEYKVTPYFPMRK
jgi:hypothetical protein